MLRDSLGVWCILCGWGHEDVRDTWEQRRAWRWLMGGEGGGQREEKEEGKGE